MGWGRTLLLGDIGNRLDIADTERDIADLSDKLSSQKDIDRHQDAWLVKIKREADETKLYLASLIRLLVAKGTLTKEELSTFVDLIDPK